MEVLSVHQRIRPVRYAFVVDEGDLASALTATSINAILWGGIYNPIVPVTPESDAIGLLKVFDPDCLIELTSTAIPQSLALGFPDRIIPRAQLVIDHPYVSGQRHLNIGFGLTHVLRQFLQEDVRNIWSTKLALVAKQIPSGWDAYVAFLLGGFSSLPDLGHDVHESRKKNFNAAEVVFDPEKDEDYANRVFPLPLTRQGIRTQGRLGGFSSHIVYHGDPTNFADLVEFWNLRATGRRIWFCATGHYRNQRTMIERVVREGHIPGKRGADRLADVQKGQSIENSAFKDFCEWIKSLGINNWGTRDWSPRFGEKIEFYVGDVHAAELVASSSEEKTFFEKGQLTPVKQLRPSFLDPDTPPMLFRWANELSVENPESNEWICVPPRVPGIDPRRNPYVATSGHTRLRDQSAVLIEEHCTEYLHIYPRRTADILNDMLQLTTSLKPRQSLPGGYAERIIHKMGSLQFDCRVFKIRGIRDIITRLGDNSELTKGEMNGIVRSTVMDKFGQNWIDTMYRGLLLKRGCDASSFSDVFDYLLSKRVIRPGLSFECGACRKSDWYHVSEFAEEYTCRYCSEKQRVPFSRGNDWKYKSDGFFRLPNGAEGSIAVILSLWRLNELRGHRRSGRFVTGIELCDTQGNVRSELDYCWLDLESTNAPYELVLGEAKNFTDHKEEQLKQLVDIANQFETRPYLGIATLKDRFSDEEKGLLNDLRRRGYELIPMTRLDLDPYDLSDRLDQAPRKHPINLKQLSESLSYVNLGPLKEKAQSAEASEETTKLAPK